MENSILEIQFNVDDMTGEQMGYLFTVLEKAGALDVSAASVIMKKNRPGVSFTIVCEEKDFNDITDEIFKHSTTFGFRYQTKQRMVLDRKIETVETKWGKVRIKKGLWKGKVVTVSPEFEDCLKISKQENISIREVMDEIKSNEN